MSCNWRSSSSTIISISERIARDLLAGVVAVRTVVGRRAVVETIIAVYAQSCSQYNPPKRIAELKSGRDRTREVEPAEVTLPMLTYTNDAAAIRGADFYMGEDLIEAQ